MTLEQFQKDDRLRSWAGQLFQTQEWRFLMEAVDSQHIRHHQMPMLKASEIDCTKHLGMVYGWDMFRNVLDATAIPPAPSGELPPATFPDPLKELEQLKQNPT